MPDQTRAKVYSGTPDEQAAAFKADRQAAAQYGWKPAQEERSAEGLRVIFQRPDPGADGPVANWPGTQPKAAPPPDTAAPGRFALSQMIAAYVARGYRVQSQDAWTAVMVKGHRVNHLLHLILTIVTGGLWLFVWVPVAMFGGERRTLLTMDGTGTVYEQPA